VSQDGIQSDTKNAYPSSWSARATAQKLGTPLLITCNFATTRKSSDVPIYVKKTEESVHITKQGSFKS
jgi:hypothetical protein